MEPYYNYSYQRVTDGPSTPDLRRGHNNNNNNNSSGGGKLGAGDYNSYRSNASGASTNPPTPVLIQVSAGRGKVEYIIKWSQKRKGCAFENHSLKGNKGTYKYDAITFRDIFTPPPPLSYCVIIWHTSGWCLFDDVILEQALRIHSYPVCCGFLSEKQTCKPYCLPC